MNVSEELQLGKAGEHLVCFDLITKGYNAFLSDQGLPYDVVVDTSTGLYRVQVKTTRGINASLGFYRYGLRRAKGSRARIDINSIDMFAFVALDTKEIGYIPTSEVVTRKGTIKQTMDFKSRHKKYSGRVYSNGTVRYPEWGKYLQDYDFREYRND